MRRAKWLVGLSILLLAGALVLAKPQADWDKAVDFSRFKTYAWQEGTPAPSTVVQDRLVHAISRELAACGLRRAEPGEADLHVYAHISLSNKLQVTSTSFAYGGYGGWGGWGGWGGGYGYGATQVNVSEIPTGSLMLDLVATDRNELVWRGMASGTVKHKPAKSEKQINSKVYDLFKRYPTKLKQK